MIKIYVKDSKTNNDIVSFEYKDTEKVQAFKHAKLIWNSMKNIRIRILHYHYNGQNCIGHYCVCDKCLFKLNYSTVNLKR